MRHILTTLLVLALTACGGGGSSSNSTGLSVSFSTSTLNFSQAEGGAPATRTMHATASGDTDKDVLLAAEVTGTGIAMPIQVAIDTASRSATITVTAASGLAAGTYTGAIKMKACANAACTMQHGGSPHTVNYTVTVHPSLNVAAQSVSLAAVETGSSQPGSFAFNPALSGAGVTTGIAYAGGYTGWLTSAVAGNTVQLVATAGTMPVGSYAATVTLTVPGSAQTAQVPVNLTVGSGMSVAAGADLTFTSSSSAQQLQGTIALALASGASATTWYATSDMPWLQLDAGSGAFGNNPSWRIDAASFNALENNADHYANITISTDATLQPRTYAVRARKALAQIDGLDTLALVDGEGGELLLYGSNFSALPAGAGAVTVSGTTPTAVSALGDTVLRVTLPALPTGSYAVSVNSASGMTTGSKTMQVTGRTAYAYQALDTQGLKSTIVWDAVSQSVFVVNATLKNVARYAPSGGTFQLVTTRSFSAIDGIAMSPDRSALIVLTDGGSIISRLSPTTLHTLSSLNLYGGSATEPMSVPLAIMGDNRLMHPAHGWVDLETGSVTPLSYADGGYYTFQLARWGAVSGNGMRMIRPDSGMYSPHAPMYHMDLLNRTFQPYSSASTPFFYRYAVSHDGSTWAMNDQVVDFDLNLKGNFALPTGWVGNEFVLSRNGSRLYYYAQNAGISSGVRIYVFDTSQALTTTVNFPVLGYIDVADMPNCAYDASGGTPECYTFNTRMAIADDDQTLFVVGDRKFLVVPVPVGLQSAATVQGSALSGQVRLPRLR